MKRSVMYVDDEAINLELFRLNFEDDFNVITAESGEEALTKLRTEHDLIVIISDLKMPGMDGLELISKIKSSSPDKICIMLTAYVETDVMMKAINEELIFRYMLKPWKRSELDRTINDAFERHSKLHI
ncbi:MAG: response regulator [Bacteroidales bacterium]|nr:response regulator [Bacteroidales bacterium]